MVPQSAPNPTDTLAVAVSLGAGAAEVSEAPFKVLVKEGVEDGVEAAVGVTQCHAEEVGSHDGSGLGHVSCQHFDQDEDVNWCPTHYKDGDHHQHQTGDPTQVAVLLARAGQQADALQSQDHQSVADCDDDNRGHKGKDEDTDLHQSVPVDIWLGELESTFCSAC